jgi:hypothetical protein
VYFPGSLIISTAFHSPLVFDNLQGFVLILVAYAASLTFFASSSAFLAAPAATLAASACLPNAAHGLSPGTVFLLNSAAQATPAGDLSQFSASAELTPVAAVRASSAVLAAAWLC